MSFKSAVISELDNHSGLTGLVATRVNPGRVLDGELPYVTVVITQDAPQTHFGGDTGLNQVRFHVNCYGESALQAQNVADQVDAALNAFTGQLGTENLNTRFIKQVDASDDFLTPDEGSQQGKHRRRIVYEAFHI